MLAGDWFLATVCGASEILRMEAVMFRYYGSTNLGDGLEKPIICDRCYYFFESTEMQRVKVLRYFRHGLALLCPDCTRAIRGGLGDGSMQEVL